MTSTDDTEKHGGDEQPVHQDADGDGKHPIRITVRTLAGHSHEETAKQTDTVAEVTHAAVRYFVHKGELSDGAYSLALIPTPARNKLGGYPRTGWRFWPPGGCR
jgi:hypothetical protein